MGHVGAWAAAGARSISWSITGFTGDRDFLRKPRLSDPEGSRRCSISTGLSRIRKPANSSPARALAGKRLCRARRQRGRRSRWAARWTRKSSGTFSATRSKRPHSGHRGRIHCFGADSAGQPGFAEDRRGWPADGMDASHSKKPEPGHRHMSHLFAVHPGRQFNLHNAPEMIAAARKTIEYRLAHGGGHTGWSRAWIINFWARFRERRKAHENVVALLSNPRCRTFLTIIRLFRLTAISAGQPASRKCCCRAMKLPVASRRRYADTGLAASVA